MNDQEYRLAAMSALDYNPETGKFIWKIRTHGMGKLIMPGDEAGFVNEQGYVMVGCKGRQSRGHRLAWLFMDGEWPPSGLDIDHINANRSDNRWTNLRLATRSQNNCNGGVRADNKSGQRGVSFAKKEGKWDARITVNGKLHLLGKYENLEDAIAVRKKAENELCGEWRPALDRKARPRHS